MCMKASILDKDGRTNLLNIVEDPSNDTSNTECSCEEDEARYDEECNACLTIHDVSDVNLSSLEKSNCVSYHPLPEN